MLSLFFRIRRSVENLKMESGVKAGASLARLLLIAPSLIALLIALSVFLYSACSEVDLDSYNDTGEIGAVKQALEQSLVEWTRYDLTTGIDNVPDKGLSYPRAVGDEAWQGVWPDGVDAAVRFRKNGYAYLFRGNQYIKYNLATDQIVTGYPKFTGVDGWKGGPQSGFDAVVHPDGYNYVYFFIGNQYWRFNIANDTFENPARQIGVNGWWGLSDVWPDGVDAAVYVKRNHSVYFFKEGEYPYPGEYVRYDLNVDHVVYDGVPRKVGERGWFNVRSEITAALGRDDNTAEFFHPSTVPAHAEALFNVPVDAQDSDATITSEFISLLDGCLSSASVWLSIPGWDHQGLADAVYEAADERNVNFKIVANRWDWECPRCGPGCNSGQGTWETVHPNVHDTLGTYRDDIHFYQTGDDPGLAALGFECQLDHAKVAVFSNTVLSDGTTGYASVVGSSNWRKHDQERPNSVVKSENPAVSRELQRYVDRIYWLSEDRPIREEDYYLFGKTAEIDRKTEIHFTPNPNLSFVPDSRDPHLEVLEDIDSQNPDPNAPNLIWVNMATWGSTARGISIMDALEDLAADFDVRIVAHDDENGWKTGDDAETKPYIWNRIAAANIPYAKTRTHNKYMLVEAKMKSTGRVQKVVVMGALNHSTAVVDGAQIEVDFTFKDNEQIFSDFKDNWFEVCDTGTSKVGNPCQ